MGQWDNVSRIFDLQFVILQFVIPQIEAGTLQPRAGRRFSPRSHLTIPKQNALEPAVRLFVFQ